MKYLNRYSKGFSLVEILTATVMLAAISAATYATFLSITRMAVTSRNELEAATEASGWLERVEAVTELSRPIRNAAASRWDRYSGHGAFTDQVGLDLNDASSILQEDYLNNWPFANKPNVSNLSATYTTEEETLGPGVPYRTVTVTVSWDEAN